MNKNILKVIKERYGIQLLEQDLKKICIGINYGMCFYMSNPNDLSQPTIKVIVRYGDSLFKLISQHNGNIINALFFDNFKNTAILNIPDLKKEIKLIDKCELKKLSHICAYCNKALRDSQKTIYHILPKCAGGENVIENYVISCKECNRKKSNYDINSYLEKNERIAQCFENYLDLIDIQKGNKEYSSDVKRYIKKHKNVRAKEFKNYKDIK